MTADSLGAWLLKANPTVSPVEELLGGTSGVTERCVRRSYRIDLIEPGQPVLLWISGGASSHPAGIHAQGQVTGPAYVSDETGRLALPVELARLETPVPRRELLAHPVLRELEVIRMPAGSNPSFLTRTELGELQAEWPQVTAG